MALMIEGVRFSAFSSEGDVIRQCDTPLRLEAIVDERNPSFRLFNGNQPVYGFNATTNVEYCRVSKFGCILKIEDKSFLIQFHRDYGKLYISYVLFHIWWNSE
ncbi:uncharacterized protein LOC144360396 [Saccoglossus kowalevskii]